MKFSPTNKILVTLSTLIISGCFSTDDNTYHPEDPFIPMMGNTENAVSFAFKNDNQIRNEFTNNGRTYYSEQCKNLVKVVDVTTGNEEEGYVTEEVFTNSNSDNCSIHRTIAMKSHLVMSGSFKTLADAQGGRIDECILIALPLESVKAQPYCLLEQVDSWNDPNYQNNHEIKDLNINSDGSQLHIVRSLARQVGEEQYRTVVSTWRNGGDLEPIYHVDHPDKYIPVSHWTYSGDNHVVGYNATNFAKNTVVMFGENGADEPVYGFNTHYLDFSDVTFRDKVVTTWRREGSDSSSAFYDRAMMDVDNLNSYAEYIENGTGRNTQLGPVIYRIDEDNVILWADLHTEDSGWEYSHGLIKMNSSLMTDFLFEQLEDTYYTHFHNKVGESELVFLEQIMLPSGQFNMFYYDLVNQELIEDNLFEEAVFDGMLSYSTSYHANGLMWHVDMGSAGTKKVYFNQLTKELSETAIDEEEISNTIPLL